MRLPRADLALVAALFAVALAARLAVLRSPPYGDEPLFWFGAANPFQAPAGVTDLGGRAFEPRGLFFERPAYFALMALPAQLGFDAFRAAAATAGALLAPAAYLLVRSRGGRWAGAIAGLAVALLPDIAVWSAFGLTDAAMTLWLAGLAWARQQGRPALATVCAIAAVWTKEMAYVAIVVLLAIDLVQARRAGELRAWPPALAPRWRAMMVPALVGLLPLMLAFTLGFPRPGVHEPGYTGRLLDELFVSPYLWPLLVAGAWLARSRASAWWGLGVGGFLLAYHGVLGGAVQAWYEVPALFFALVGAAASADALARWAWSASSSRAWRRSGTVAVCAVAALAVLAAIAAPAGAARDWIHPVNGDAGYGLGDRLQYEVDVRDRDFVATVAALPPGGFDLVTLDVGFPRHLHPLAQRADHVWVLSWPTYEQRFEASAVAARVEANGTLTMVAEGGSPRQAALLSTYGDCIVFRNPGFAVVEGPRCAGRAGRLDAAAGGILW